MDIKIATSSDFKSIRSIAENTWPDTFGSILSAQQIDYMLKKMYSDEALEKQLGLGHIFLMASLSSEKSGFASYQLNYKNNSAKLHKLYVLPTAHGSGLGKGLIKEVISIARANGQQSLFVNVNRHNPAVEFYKYLGFEIVGEEDIDIGNNYFMNDYVMELKLS